MNEFLWMFGALQDDVWERIFKRQFVGASTIRHKATGKNMSSSVSKEAGSFLKCFFLAMLGDDFAKRNLFVGSRKF